ncbi:MAG: L-methionine (R)-S-oxide reductase [Crocinitomix sp.]|jgi:L-methionine (R)-S-oxide reductase
MADELILGGESREEKYQTLIPQIKALITDEPDLVANCANIAAALRQTFDFFWVGFYFVKEDEMVLGPFQGDIACTRIAKGRGVCGTVWQNAESLIVPNVNNFPGHISCSAASLSEIVVPIINKGQVRSVLDVDSDKLDDFNAIDRKYLTELAEIIADRF